MTTGQRRSPNLLCPSITTNNQIGLKNQNEADPGPEPWVCGLTAVSVCSPLGWN